MGSKLDFDPDFGNNSCRQNYPREEEDTKFPICNQKEDTTEHVLEFQTAETVYKIKDNNTPNQWAEVVKLYRQNKEQRK